MDMQYCAQANYGPAFNYAAHGQPMNIQYPDEQYNMYTTGYNALPYLYNPQHGRHLPTEHAVMADVKTESKPRLSKEEVEKLEKVFQENPKPSSSMKANLADELQLERPRINNWFQNRRAKAKTTKKLEEYEARRALENEAAESASPDEAAVKTEEATEESVSTCTSSAPFPGLTSDLPPQNEALHDEDSPAGGQYGAGGAARLSHEVESPFLSHLTQAHQGGVATDMQSPVSLNFASSDQLPFDFPPVSQDYQAPPGTVDYHPMEATSTGSPIHNPATQPEQSTISGSPVNDFACNEQYNANIEYPPSQFFPNNAEMSFIQQMFTPDEQASEAPPAMSGTAPEESPLGRSKPILSNLTIPESHGDSAFSFKSPPPPANIASRRNMTKPAALQAASLRCRPFSLPGGPKSSLEGSRRTDASSPASHIHRIASSTGNMGGRIQKQGAGARSPMFLNRNTENYLQYHSRSPVGTLASASAFPPTPLTPAIYGQQDVHEPAVASHCSDDEAFMLGDGSTGLGLANSLKTPPRTPGIPCVPQNYAVHHPLSAGLDFADLAADLTPDQPLLTPVFQTEFPDLSQHRVPGYLEAGDTSMPSTPLFAEMMNMTRDTLPMLGGGSGNPPQYDWDANESINASTASPSQARSKQVLFTQNRTPQDYCLHES